MSYNFKAMFWTFESPSTSFTDFGLSHMLESKQSRMFCIKPATSRVDKILHFDNDQEDNFILSSNGSATEFVSEYFDF